MDSKDCVVNRNFFSGIEVDEYGYVRSREEGNTIVVFAACTDAAPITLYTAIIRQILS